MTDELTLERVPAVHMHCFFDNDPARWGSTVAGVLVRQPSAAAFDSVDFILVTSVHMDAISRQVVEAGDGAKLVLDPVVLSTLSDAIELLS